MTRYWLLGSTACVLGCSSPFSAADSSPLEQTAGTASKPIEQAGQAGDDSKPLDQAGSGGDAGSAGDDAPEPLGGSGGSLAGSGGSPTLAVAGSGGTSISGAPQGGYGSLGGTGGALQGGIGGTAGTGGDPLLSPTGTLTFACETPYDIKMAPLYDVVKDSQYFARDQGCNTTVTLPVGGPYLIVQRYYAPIPMQNRVINNPGQYIVPGANTFSTFQSFGFN